MKLFLLFHSLSDKTHLTASMKKKKRQRLTNNEHFFGCFCFFAFLFGRFLPLFFLFNLILVPSPPQIFSYAFLFQTSFLSLSTFGFIIIFHSSHLLPSFFFLIFIFVFFFNCSNKLFSVCEQKKIYPKKIVF